MGHRTDAYPFLPEPEMITVEPPEPPTAGWWQDVDASALMQRYHDGTRWTQYTCRMAGRRWTAIEERPRYEPG